MKFSFKNKNKKIPEWFGIVVCCCYLVAGVGYYLLGVFHQKYFGLMSSNLFVMGLGGFFLLLAFISNNVYQLHNQRIEIELLKEALL